MTRFSNATPDPPNGCSFGGSGITCAQPAVAAITSIRKLPTLSGLLLAATTPTSVTAPAGRGPLNVSTYRSKSSNWVRVTLVTLLLILGLVIGMLGGTSSRSSAGSTPVPSVVSTPPSVELVAPLGSSSTGSTGSRRGLRHLRAVPEPEPEPEPDPTRTRWDPTTWRRTPSPSLTRIRWDPTTWRRIPIPKVNSTLDSGLAEQQLVR